MKSRQQLAIDLRYVLLSMRVGAVDSSIAADLVESLWDARDLSESVQGIRERREREAYLAATPSVAVNYKPQRRTVADLNRQLEAEAAQYEAELARIEANVPEVINA